MNLRQRLFSLGWNNMFCSRFQKAFGTGSGGLSPHLPYLHITNVTVNTKLDVIASGGSIVNYRGNGVINSQNLSGGSTLNKR
jgi:hypothetical protein